MIRSGGLALCAAALAALASPAAATDEEIISLYEQSGQAWDAGRIDEAVRLGEAAWRQAEAEWGASEDTALLAEALVRQHLLSGANAAAVAPAARVVELVETGAAPSLSSAEARLALTLARFDTSAASEESMQALQAALSEAEAANVPPGVYLWAGWLQLARARSGAEDWEQAQAAGENVMNVMDIAADVPDGARVEAAIITATAASTDRDYARSEAAFAWALNFIPARVVQDGEDAPNPAWLTLAAYEHLAAAGRHSLGQESAAGADIFNLDEMDAGGDVCPGVTWGPDGRTPPVYPSDALMKGLIGSAFAEYELAADGTVRNAEILISIPDESFGEASLESMDAWRAEGEGLSGCVGKRLLTAFRFVLESAGGATTGSRIRR